MKEKYFAICLHVSFFKPLRSGKKGSFPEKVRENNIGFQEKSQGKFVLFRQKSEEFFSKRLYGEIEMLLLKQIFTLVFLKVLFLDLIYFSIYRTYLPDKNKSMCEVFSDDTSFFLFSIMTQPKNNLSKNLE